VIVAEGLPQVDHFDIGSVISDHTPSCPDGEAPLHVPQDAGGAEGEHEVQYATNSSTGMDWPVWR
jgi:hypothetical protein